MKQPLSMDRARRRQLVVLLIGLVLLLLLTRDRPGSWSDLSRLATAWAVSEHCTLQIDTPDNYFGAATGDKALINGHFYSDKPPVMGVLAGVAAWGLKAAGGGFAQASRLCVYLLTLLFVGLPFLAYLALLLGRLPAGGDGLQLGLIALLGSLALPYASVFNNHLPAGCLLGLVMLRRLDRNAQPSAALADGLLLGLASTLDLGAILAGGPLAAWVFLFRLTGSKARAAFILAGLAPLALHAALTIPLTGDLGHPSLHPELMLFPGARLAAGELTGVFGPAWSGAADWLGYLFDLTLGAKGFLTHNPLVFLGFLGLILALAGRPAQGGRLLAGAIALGATALMVYYSLYSNNFGGYNYSIRWFILLIPLLLPYALTLLGGLTGVWRKAGLLLAWVSVGLVLAGWPDPWLPSHTESLDLIAGFKLWPGFLGKIF
ncbi:MAG: hypothetical protein JRC92_03785 [Deltaproteobacteria bacterium]|nr:hypothetical protein [Deltaproteobacteria bacterium]